MSRLIALFIAAIALLGGVPAATADPETVEAVAYGAFRVVRETPGTPSTPQVTLPAGYSFVSGSQYRTATRADWYGFIQGPAAASVPIIVRWPGVPVSTVVTSRTLVPVTRDADAVTFAVP